MPDSISGPVRLVAAWMLTTSASFAETAQTGPTAPSPPATAVTGNGITLTSVTVDFPGSDRVFPDGAGAETVTDNCTACHSPGMILNQPALAKSEWQQIVDQMVRDFKAPVDGSDVPAIVDYLARLKR